MPGPVVAPPPINTTSKGSINQSLIDSYVQALQREVKPNVLYNALSKIKDDLAKVYTTLFDGPLPAVDGFNLTRINAAVLNGIIPPEYHLAYWDVDNEWSSSQTMVDDGEFFWKMGFGDLLADPAVEPLSWMRLGAIADESFFLSQNLFFDATWQKDNGADGASVIQLEDGDIFAKWFDSGLGDVRNTFLFRGPELFFANFDDDDYLSFLQRDDNDVLRVGGSSEDDGTPVGFFAIPVKATVELPSSGNADADGIIVIDDTAIRLVIYANGLRYRSAVFTAF